MALTKEQYIKAREAGYTPEQIASFEQNRAGTAVAPSKEQIAENEVESRPSAIADLTKNPTTIKHPLGAVLRTMQGAAELYQGVPASIALDLQKGKPEDILPNLGKVVTGQRPAEYGDVFRRAGVPKPLASGLGFVVNTALAPGGKDALQSITKVPGAIKGGAINATKLVKDLVKYKTNAEQAQTAYKAIEGIKDNLGNAVTIAIQRVKDLPTNANLATKSERVATALRNPIYEIEFDSSGQVVQTLGNLNKVKNAIGEAIPKASFDKAGTTEIGHMKRLYGTINGEMRRVARNAGSPIDEELGAFEKLMDHYEYIKSSVVDKHNNAVGNLLKTAFKSPAKEVNRKAFEEVSKISPEIKAVMKSMKKRVLLDNMLKAAPLVGGGTLGAGYLIKKFKD